MTLWTSSITQAKGKQSKTKLALTNFWHTWIAQYFKSALTPQRLNECFVPTLVRMDFGMNFSTSIIVRWPIFSIIHRTFIQNLTVLRLNRFADLTILVENVGLQVLVAKLFSNESCSAAPLLHQFDKWVVIGLNYLLLDLIKEFLRQVLVDFEHAFAPV